MQRYDEKQLIPKNQAKSSRSCCDRLGVLRQSRGMRGSECRKGHKKSPRPSQAGSDLILNHKPNAMKKTIQRYGYYLKPTIII